MQDVMTRILAVLLLSPAVAGAPTADAFTAWAAQHGKTYASDAAEQKAREAFEEMDAFIKSHDQATWTVGHNEFSDMRPSERHWGLRSAKRNHTAPAVESVEEPLLDLPESVDWVAAGAVGPVRNQGQCGSCWAFSAAGAIEGALQIAGGGLSTVSVEELVQCDTQSSGCTGGAQVYAYEFVRDHGIVADAIYPYTSGPGVTGVCNGALTSTDLVAKLRGYQTPRTYSEMKAAVAKQPVAVGLFAEWNGFQAYTGGIISSAGAEAACLGQAVDHGVLIVGYGVDAASGIDYWKVKNSWGASWGDGGYFKIQAGSNICGIESDASYPTGVSPYTPLPPSPPRPPPSPPRPPSSPPDAIHKGINFLEHLWNQYFNWFAGLPGVRNLNDNHTTQVAIAAAALALVVLLSLCIFTALVKSLCKCCCSRGRQPATYAPSNIVVRAAPMGEPLLTSGAVPMGQAVNDPDRRRNPFYSQ